MSSDYISIPEKTKLLDQPEVKANEQKTPERITVKYQTTGIIKDISEEGKDES